MATPAAHTAHKTRNLTRFVPRWGEMGLMVFAPALLAVGMGTIDLAGGGQWETASTRLPVVALLVLWATSLLLARFAPLADQLLLPIIATLMGVSLLLMHALRPQLLDRQVLWMALSWGVAIGIVLAPIDIRRLLRRYRYTWATLGLVLVGLTFIFGRYPGGPGPRLWLGFGNWYFQPSELLKLLLIAFLASYLDEYRELLAQDSWKLGPWRLWPLPYLVPLGVMSGFALLLVIWQRDLGMAMLFLGVFLAMLYVASNRGSYIVMGLVIFVAGAWVVYHAFGHVRERFDIWLNPWATPSDEGYQVIQGLIALAAGGLLGQGLGYGASSYIPAVHTDYVFAAWVEMTGLAGGMGLIGLLLLFVVRGFHIAQTARLPYDRLLATGLATLFALQTLVILGGNLKLLPLTGVTLPFVSYGGSSLLICGLAAGLLLRLSARDPAGRW
ncbi:MAG: FtsW/RodA/SpoVE family cell cycle protein [Chloroflexi bacterium]|nr:FtsW/RodA/SpoVE family cell cycle protein [Chloroflexota bacterium]